MNLIIKRMMYIIDCFCNRHDHAYWIITIGTSILLNIPLVRELPSSSSHLVLVSEIATAQLIVLVPSPHVNDEKANCIHPRYWGKQADALLIVHELHPDKYMVDWTFCLRVAYS